MPLFPLHVLLVDVPAVIDALQGAGEGLLPLPVLAPRNGRAGSWISQPLHRFVLSFDKQPRLGVVEIGGDPTQRCRAVCRLRLPGRLNPSFAQLAGLCLAGLLVLPTSLGTWRRLAAVIVGVPPLVGLATTPAWARFMVPFEP